MFEAKTKTRISNSRKELRAKARPEQSDHLRAKIQNKGPGKLKVQNYYRQSQEIARHQIEPRSNTAQLKKGVSVNRVT